jgi:hypothetical protein
LRLSVAVWMLHSILAIVLSASSHSVLSIK